MTKTVNDEPPWTPHRDPGTSSMRNTSRNNAEVLPGTERYSEVLDPKVVTL